MADRATRHGGTDPPTGAGVFAQVAVVGGGLIGGSFALAARRAGVARVVVTDAAAEVRERATALGIGRVEADPCAAVADADLVVLAVPVEAIPEVAAQVVVCMKIPSILTDVGSVKFRVVREIEGFLPKGIQYIGGHPMAGSEYSGIDAADPTIFQGATYLLTPTENADAGAFNQLAALLRAMGARVLAVEPDVHDRLVAMVSHLPQVLASVLMARATEATRSTAGLLALAAGGFRDVTRVAASDPILWEGILRENRTAVLAEIEAYLERLVSFRDALAGQEWNEVAAILTAARDARRALPVKEAAEVLVDVIVPIDDRPGTLAEVTTALGEAGLNIEDLSMRHASDGARGALVLALAGHDAAERAREVLARRGHASHVEPR